jgi:hypothetical protein
MNESGFRFIETGRRPFPGVYMKMSTTAWIFSSVVVPDPGMGVSGNLVFESFVTYKWKEA